jgi:hypothetical protein
VNESDEQRWLPPLSDKLTSGPFQPPPPRNWLEAKWRNLRWHLTMLRRHRMWD